MVVVAFRKGGLKRVQPAADELVLYSFVLARFIYEPSQRSTLRLRYMDIIYAVYYHNLDTMHTFYIVLAILTSPSVGVRSIVISVYVCMYVCLFLGLHISKITRPDVTKFSVHESCGRCSVLL